MFGAGSGNTSSFNFGGATSTTQSSAPSTGSFGSSTGTGTTANKTGGFTFGNVTQTTSAPSTGFSLGGVTSSAPATGFSLAGTAASAPATGFNFGNTGTSTTTTATPQGTAVSTAGPGGFSFGTTPTVTGIQAVKPIQPTTGATSSAASSGFNFGTLGGVKPATTTSSGPATGLSFNLTSTTSTTGGLVGSSTATSTAAAGTSSTGASGFALPVQSTTTHPSTSAATGFAPTTTTAASGLPQAQITYQQLEENINKWMADLEKQEKDFLQQATQVNAWDRLLVENGEKITALNSDMERVKIDQQKLDHELDFIKSQQRELEELLVPLEKSVEQQPNNFQHHADLERENTYQLAENVDAQLKRMVLDLKEIIEHLNTNSSQDNTDPIQQITKILNAHMDALQWVDQNTALLGRRIEDVGKQMEVQRKEQERNFRLVYN